MQPRTVSKTAPGHGVARGKAPDGTEIWQLHEVRGHQALATGGNQVSVLHIGNAGDALQVPVLAVVLPGKQDVAQLADDVLALAVDDNVETTPGKGFFGQGAHLGAAAEYDEVRVKFAGLSRDFVGAGRLVDQGRDHQDVHAV